ncbi:DUF4747 family protein [uncultured Desulfobacter sp.]|uniref:DUF4747 family protein n=1 Tax=uncultured Desulfobacter sp. TaxID=240139 RepID=UPI002AAC3BB1|nr:DUF4747 family protein [uncultured Desulfobacter sp.]
MAKERTMQMSILNIKIHPHTPKLYVKMFKGVFTRKHVGKIRGSDSGMIGSFRDDLYNKHQIYYGYIYKFLNIDPNEKWLNLTDFKTIDPQETGELPVPHNLKPNLRQIGYIFYPAKHRVLFNSTSFSPNSMLSLFNGLFNTPEIEKEFGQVDLNIEATQEAITKIIQIPKLTKLSINFTRPNNDDMEGLEGAVRARIENQNIKRFRQESSTNDEEGMLPDEETIALMNVARSNGSVYAIGYDGEEKKEYSTKDHPIKERIKYDPELATETNTMVGFGIDLIKKFFK